VLKLMIRCEFEKYCGPGELCRWIGCGQAST
jgi:hypothetical protein